MAYVKSEDVKKREQDYYAYLKNNNPGEFSSEYTDKANAALADIENMGEFKYNPATDVGYQAARKQYTAGGQQAMKDTLGAATELTGGYDNSYAQVAAQQTFNRYMSELANMMPQFENQAYGRYQDQRNQKIDYYGIMENARQRAYNEHMDKVNRYNAEADRLYGLYGDAYNADYTAYRDSVADQQYADQWALTQEQWEHDKAMDNASATAAQTSAEADYYKALAEYEDGLAGEEPLFYEYAGDEKDDSGNIIGKNFYYNGKLRNYDVGINPYTNTRNDDAKNGTFSNGYQPDNVGGKKLSKTGYQTDDNGKLQNIYTTNDGHYWLWNGVANEYEEVENPEPDRTALTSKTKKQKGLTM